MDGSDTTAQPGERPGALRIETGEQTATVQVPAAPLPTWVAPTAAGAAVFFGITVAALGVLWLRQRPVREPTHDELFEQTAAALGLSKEQRATILATASKAKGVPSAAGIAMWS
ncbi:MAG TPA: hypothetical protein VHN77_12705 [Phycisphaerales bacterium]|nr:hypothetical protein [Phycisphaerales bacterium]